MEQILLDTNFVSVLFDVRRSNFAAVQARAQSFSPTDSVYLSVVVLAELRYGMEAAQRVGHDISHVRRTLDQAATYPLAEIGRHIAETYGDIKARLADCYLDMSRRPPVGLRTGRTESPVSPSRLTRMTSGSLLKRSSATTY